MRTIKFRAWDGEDMLTHENIGDDYDFQLAPNGLILMVNEQFHEMGSGVAEEYWRYVEIKDAKFMQFTGLTDKNGVDIYEGDIVSAEVKERGISECGEYNVQTGNYITTNLSVEHVDHMTHCGWKFYGTDRRFNAKATRSFIVNNKIEVVGNIYSDPELLK